MAVKTNLMGWATTTCNLGTEFSVGKKSTIQLFGALNPWEFSGNKRFRYWTIMPEYRWWLCQSFNGFFFGAHAMAGQFNIKNVDVPLGILPKIEKGRHYEGWYVGAGITYGYQWVISSHWNIEASVGVGYDHIKYKLYGYWYRYFETYNTFVTSSNLRFVSGGAGDNTGKYKTMPIRNVALEN
ncbi:MAG: DUF3575 domain-containing protein [Phocaeicola sp.]